MLDDEKNHPSGKVPDVLLMIQSHPRPLPQNPAFDEPEDGPFDRIDGRCRDR